jgi:hypothetical protein
MNDLLLADGKISYLELNGSKKLINVSGEVEITSIPNYKNFDFAYFGSNVSSLGISACVNASNLKYVKMSDSISNISDYAFRACPNLISVDFSSSLTSIPMQCFRSSFTNDEPKKLIIPEGIKTINAYAFDGAIFDYIDIPSSISLIGASAFYIKSRKDTQTSVMLSSFTNKNNPPTLHNNNFSINNP